MGRKNVKDALKPLKWLFGKWKTTEGFMKIPYEKPLPYREEISFEPDGCQPLLNYTSKSWNAETEKPEHAERGFILLKPETKNVSFILAHNRGLVSVEEGCVSNKSLEVASIGVRNLKYSFKQKIETKGIKRQYKYYDGKLHIVIYLSTNHDPTLLYEHLRATYEKGDC